MLAVIVLAHGSRDPLWRAPVEAVAQRVAQRRPDVAVRCAYLELCGPDLPTAAGELIAAGARTVHVLPLFFGMGKHAREDLPQLLAALKQAHPTVHIEALRTAGEDDQLIDLLAGMALKERA